MNIYCDMEFTGLRQDTKLISIGIIAEDGKMFYMEANDYDIENDFYERDREWSKINVIPYLMFNDKEDVFQTGAYKSDMSLIKTYMKYFGKTNTEAIGKLLKEWLSQYDDITFMGDVPAYDWILFVNLLGRTSIELPPNVSFKAMDLATTEYVMGISSNHIRDSKYLQGNEPWMKDHNALYDAIIIKEQFAYCLKAMKEIKAGYQEYKKNKSEDDEYSFTFLK